MVMQTWAALNFLVDAGNDAKVVMVSGVVLSALLLWRLLRHNLPLKDQAKKKTLYPPGTLPFFKNTFQVLQHATDLRDWEALECERVSGQTWAWQIVGNPVWIVTSTPELFEDILQTQFRFFGKGEFMREKMVDLFGDGIFAVDGSTWLRQRKTASNLFSQRSLRDYMACSVQEHITTLHGILDEYATSGDKIDMFKLFNRFTMEVFAEIAFGVQLGCLDMNKDHPFETAFDQAQMIISRRFFRPDFVWKVLKWFNVGSEKKLREHVRTLNDVVFTIISKSLKAREKKENLQVHSGKRGDLISLFLDNVSYDSGKPDESFDPVFLRDIVLSFLAAGRDTSAQALSWFYYCLSRSPDVEHKIRQELTEKLPELRSGDIASPSMDQVQSLVYLEAALKETLRLYPSVPSNCYEALVDTVLCDGTHVTKGTLVGFAGYTMGRMTHVWGPDAKEFKPERWLDPVSGKLQAVSPYKFSAFHAGPRMCLGMNLAMMEMKIVVASLLSKYHLTPTDPSKKVTYAMSLTIPMKDGLDMTVSRI